MAGTFRVKQFVKSHGLANKLHAHIWLLKTCAIPASHGLLPSYDKVERWITIYIKGFWQCWKGFLESDTPLFHGKLCESVAWSPCSLTGFPAAMRLYNSLTQCNSSMMRKVLQADMQLSSRPPECWSSMEGGLTQSYMFKQKLLNCEPMDLSRFVVDLRDRHLEFWTPFSDSHLESATAIRLLITSGAHCLHKRALVTILPRLPKYMLPTLSRDVIRIKARFRFHVHRVTPFALR
jgi:hypothetical protein